MSTSGSVGAETPRKARAKGWLLAFSIAGIALGAIDAFSGLSTAMAPAMLRFQSRVMAGLPDKTPAIESQNEMFEKTAAVYERHRSAVLVGALGRTTVGVAMIIAGIGCLSLRRWGRKLLIGAYLGGAMLAVGLGPEMVRVQKEVNAESTAHIERTLRRMSATGANQQVTDMMGTAMRTTGSFVTIAAIGFIVLMAAACVAGAVFLLHPRTRARFEPPAPS
jgi:hypothetical protein